MISSGTKDVDCSVFGTFFAYKKLWSSTDDVAKSEDNSGAGQSLSLSSGLADLHHCLLVGWLWNHAEFIRAGHCWTD